MSEYAFTTEWRVRAPIEAVWERIADASRWPEWWRGLERVVDLAPGGANRLGAVQRFTWKGRLPYTLDVEMRVTRSEPPVLLESSARGELDGIGRWRLSRVGNGTLIRYEWNVRTTKRWMNALAPVAGPLFRWNHDVVMRGGERGLKRLLEDSG